MSNNSSHNMVFMGAAVIGVLGAIGMFIAEQFYAEKRRGKLAQDVSRLNQQLTSTRIELEHLKESMKESQKSKQKQRRPRRALPPPPSKDQSPGHSTEAVLNGASRVLEDTSVVSDTDYFTEYTSGDYESGSDEFYDLSSGDETTEPIGHIVRNGRRGSKTKNTLVDVLTRVDSLLKESTRNDIEEARALLLNENSKTAEVQNAAILWRLGKCCYKLAKIESDVGNEDERKRITNEGIDHCTRALQIDDKDAEVHKWYAIIVGSQNEYLGNKEKILNGQIFIKHITEALKLSPFDASLYHLAGRFKYEISGLTWFERKMASTLFGEVPMATYNDAFQDFYKAEELNEADWKENRLLLAKCCIGNSDYIEAVKWLNLASSIPTSGVEEQIVESEVQKLLATYSSYAKS